MTSRRSDDCGFTLIELLVAITLLGLLMAALFGGLQLGARAWETSGTRQDDSARLQVVQDFLRERLGQALPLEIEGAAGEVDLAFEGREQALRFVTLLPEHLGAGLHVFVLRRLERDGRAHLALAWQPFAGAIAATGGAPPPAERLLIADVADLRISYFGALLERERPQWHAMWSGRQARLPELIRIQISFAAGDQRRWPTLIVRPMLDPGFLATF